MCLCTAIHQPTNKKTPPRREVCAHTYKKNIEGKKRGCQPRALRNYNTKGEYEERSSIYTYVHLKKRKERNTKIVKSWEEDSEDGQQKREKRKNDQA